MKIIKWLLIIILGLAIAAAGFLAYMGAFTNLTAKEGMIGPYVVAYEMYIGEYKNTGSVFDRVYKQLTADGIKTTDGLGIYYDDPSVVAKDKLRSLCGVIINPGDVAKIKKMKKYKIKFIPKAKSIIVEFPIRNMFSYMLGPSKGYPALVKHASEKSYQITVPMEIYDMQNNVIKFIMPIKKAGKK